MISKIFAPKKLAKIVENGEFNIDHLAFFRAYHGTKVTLEKLSRSMHGVTFVCMHVHTRKLLPVIKHT
jgi:hypothetical protein